MNLTALLQTHMVARRAIRRLEVLCERYPDPVLRDAIETLRREAHEGPWRTDAPDVPGGHAPSSSDPGAAREPRQLG
jgi:hypothetical protein